MTAASARVDVLTAEVRTLMVGSRQVTLSVYRQLDFVERDKIKPFGRVRSKSRRIEGAIELVGARRETGALARCEVCAPEDSCTWSEASSAPDEIGSSWCVVGPSNEDVSTGWSDRGCQYTVAGEVVPPERGKLLIQTYRPTAARIASRDGYHEAWWVPQEAAVDLSMPPGSWRYVDSATKAMAEKYAARCLDAIFAELGAYYADAALPLIVLAGLR